MSENKRVVIWTMFAYKYDECFMYFGCLDCLKALRLSRPIARVEIIEDPAGDYYGWIEDEELQVAYIWPSEIQMEMCFPYGSQVEEAKGVGKKVRLSVKEF